MKTLQNLTRWMEKNLEQPFYQAEIARAELSRGDVRRHNKGSYRGIKHGKVALRVTK